MSWIYIVSVLLFLVVLTATYLLYQKFFGKEKVDYHPVRFMSRVAIFGAMCAILYAVPVFKFPLPALFPSFLEFHFDEVPAFICGFAYGPIAGLCCIAIKTIVKVLISGSSTFFIGEFCDLILSAIYVGIVTLIYQKKRNLKGVAIGFSAGTLIQVVVAMLLNVYVLIPAYVTMIGESALLAMMNTSNLIGIANVTWSYAFLAVLPFNLIKDVAVIIITFLIYRSIHTFLRMDKKKTAK
ncbi:MAG: ECF transporter S component [Bacillota bacterium]|nr:ECF transporter S component [Bacillota bacterium]